MNTNICRKNKFKGNCILTVKIRETTAGSQGKEFNYRTHRVRIPKADKPTGLAFDPEFTTKAKSLRKKAKANFGKPKCSVGGKYDPKTKECSCGGWKCNNPGKRSPPSPPRRVRTHLEIFYGI